MIYTVTFNPSIDYTISLDKYLAGEINRCSNEHILIGGKGINVSMVLKNLGLNSTAIGFTAGFTGDEIERRLKKYGLSCQFIRIQSGFSRINVKMKGEQETEINGSGPEITNKDILILMKNLSSLCKGDYLVLAGSIPKSVSNTIYSDIMQVLEGKGVEVIVDATGDLLSNVLKYKPFLIKPNNHELEDFFKVKIGHDKGKIIEYAKKLQEMGARNVLVSMAGHGAVLCTEGDETYTSHAPEGKIVNSVGAGDSMVAGFLAGYIENQDYHHAFKLGISAGSASAFSENLAVYDEIMQIFDKM